MGVNVGSLEWDAVIHDSGFNSQLIQIEVNLNSLSQQAEKTGNELDSIFKRAAIAAAGYFSVQQASNFIQSLITTRGEFQQLEIAFTTMLRSKEKADALMKDVVQFAATTPFDLKQVAAGTKQLLAYGFAAEDMQENLSMLGNVASGVGSQISDIIYLYGTLRASGRVTQMDINQFAGRGIPIYAELARVLQVNVEQVRDFVSAGKVGFEDIENAFKNMTNESGMFFNLMQEESKSLKGQLANLEDAWESMLNELGQSQEGLFSKGIESIAALVENYQKVLDIIKVLIITYGTYRAAMIVNTLALSKMSAMELLHYGRLVIVQRAQALLNATILANPYVAAATALGALISALVIFRDNTTNAQKAQIKLNDALSDSEKSTVEQTIKLQDLVKVARDETRSKGEREKAIKQINSISPEYLSNITLETINTNKSTEAIENYITALKRKAREEALYNARVDLHKEMIAIDAGERDGLLDNVLGFGRALVGGNWAKHLAETRQDAKKAIQEQLDVIDEETEKALKENASKENIKAEVIQNKKFWEDKKAEAQTALDALSIIDAQGEKGKALLKQIAEYDEKIAAYANQKIKGSKAENNLLSLLKDISNAERKALQSGLEKDESEIDRINQGYDDLEKRAKELGLNSEIFKRIENSRKIETGNERQKQEIDEFQKAINRQKEIFDSFEDYKTRIGENRAKEIYSAEIDEFDNYIDYLKAELKKLEGDNSIGAAVKRTFLNDNLSKAEIEDSKQQAEKYVKLIELAETSNQKILRIETKFQEDILKLKGEISDEELTILTQKKEDEINAIKEAELQKLNTYKRSGEEILLFTRDQVNKQIKAMRNLLKTGVVKDELRTQIENNLKGLEAVLKIGIDESNIQILKRQRDQIIKQIEARKQAKITSPENEKELQDLLDKLILIENEIDEINAKGLSGFLSKLKNKNELIELSEWMGLAADSAFVLSDALGGVDTQAGYTLRTIAELSDSTANLSASLATGNPVQIVGAAVRAVGSILSIGRRTKEMNAAARKAVEEFYAQAIRGEKEYQDLLNRRALESVRDNKVRIKGIQDEIALRKKQADADLKEFNDIMLKVQGQSYIQDQKYKHGTWFRKAKVKNIMGSLQGKTFEELSSLLSQGRLEGETKALVERLVELEQRGYDASQAIAELAKETAELFTGTTADALTESLAQMVRDGKTDVQSLADFFESTMQDAALSIFKNKVLADMMADFYESFSKAVTDDDGLTAADIEVLRAKWLSDTSRVQREWEDMQKVTGLDFSKSPGSALKGNIERMTEQTASELTGIYRANFDLAKREYEESLKRNEILYRYEVTARGTLEAVLKIEQHTFNTVKRLDTVILQLNGISESIGGNGNDYEQTDRDLGI